MIGCRMSFWLFRPLGRVGFEGTFKLIRPEFFIKLAEFFYKFAENLSILKVGFYPQNDF